MEATGRLKLRGMGVDIDGGGGVVNVRGSMINLG